MKKRPWWDRRKRSHINTEFEKDRRTMKERRKEPWITKTELKEFVPAFLILALLGLLMFALSENSDLRDALAECVIIEEVE